MSYPFLKKYVANSYIETADVKRLSKLRHLFHALSDEDIKIASDVLPCFPEELLCLYKEIGFGILHQNKQGYLNRIFSPAELMIFNTRTNEYRYDRELLLSVRDDALVFFESYRYGYLTIDVDLCLSGNIIRYKGEKISDSLYDFLNGYDYDKSYLKYRIEEAHEALQKKALCPSLPENTQNMQVPQSPDSSSEEFHSWILDD